MLRVNKNHKIEQYLVSIGAKKGEGTKKVKKRSGRPASLHTQKSYAFCVYKNGKWTEATGETAQEMEVFQSLKDNKLLNQYMATTELPKNLPANIQWEKTALKIMAALAKEHSEYEYFTTFNDQSKDFSVSWDEIYKYPDVNKEPVNLGIIKQKLTNNEYFRLQDWCDDMNRLFNNVLLFNKNKETLIKAVDELRKKFVAHYNSYQLDFYL